MFTVLLPCVLQKGHRLSVLAVLKQRLYQVCTASAVKSFSWFLDFALGRIQLDIICLALVPHSGLMTSIMRYCSCWRKNELTERQCTLLLQTGLWWTNKLSFLCILVSIFLKSRHCSYLCLLVKCGGVSKLQYTTAVTSSLHLVDADR